jgi:NAD(P)-dependent dehydrogenase (short-subunit alcohol dehydrogenase family)
MSAFPLVPTVLVTGAAKLLGREVALRLAANGCAWPCTTAIRWKMLQKQ